jgi:ribosomal protein S18 acetylase RimI-like enzyme
MSLPSGVPLELRLRRPMEADHPRLVAIVDDWWGGRRLHDLLPRLWLQFFTGTSWIAETRDGRLAGFLIGFISPDDPTLAYIHMVASNPELRKQAVGRAMYEAFLQDVAGRGARQAKAITWAGNTVSIGFHLAMGFQIVEGPGTRQIMGVTAFPDHGYPGEDRVVFVRGVRPPS